MKHETIFITVFHSFVSKNILNTNVLKILTDRENLTIVLLVPKSKKEYIQKYYGSKSVLVEGVDVNKMVNARANIFFFRLSLLLIDSHYLWYKKVERRDADVLFFGTIKYWIRIILTKVLSGYKIIHTVYRLLNFRFTSKNLFDELFEKYHPTLVFSTDVFDQKDALLLKEAKKHNVFTLGMVRSWDNCYSKGLLQVIPDEILVNSSILKEEVTTLHDASPEQVHVVGLPQFDAFVKDSCVSKDIFFDSLSIDAQKKLILFAPAGSVLSDTDWEICTILKDALGKGEIKHSVQFFIRNHPHHPADLSKFCGNNNFIIESPGEVLDKNNTKDTELSPQDNKHLATLLKHSDLVIWTATTLGLDATVFDKPQIVIDFDGFKNKKYTESVRRYHNEDHMKKLLQTGGVKIVKNQTELVQAINMYLEDPTKDKMGRNRIVKGQLYKLDGKSGERVAHQILKYLDVSK